LSVKERTKESTQTFGDAESEAFCGVSDDDSPVAVELGAQHWTERIPFDVRYGELLTRGVQ